MLISNLSQYVELLKALKEIRGIKSESWHLMRYLQLTPPLNQVGTVLFATLPADEKPRILFQVNIGIGTTAFTSNEQNFELFLMSDTKINLPFSILPTVDNGGDIHHNRSVCPLLCFSYISPGKPVEIILKYRQNVQYIDCGLTFLQI